MVGIERLAIAEMKRRIRQEGVARCFPATTIAINGKFTLIKKNGVQIRETAEAVKAIIYQT